MSFNLTIGKTVKMILILSFLNVVFVFALSFFTYQLVGINRQVANPDYAVHETVENKENFPDQPKIYLPAAVFNLAGKIIQIEDDSIVFNASIQSKDEKGNIVSDAELRKANINPATIVKQLTFVKNSPVEKNIKLSDLKKGDYIEAVSDKNIISASEFNATQILLIP